MSNPIKRAWPADWSGAAEASYLKKYWPSYGDSALRLRHGARVACKRLREERDNIAAVSGARAEAMRLIMAERDRAIEERAAARSQLNGTQSALTKTMRELTEESRRHQDTMGRNADLTSQRDLARGERDAAQLELRALEWLTFQSQRQSFSFGFDERATGRVVWVSRPWNWSLDEFTTYASAARALGWEG